MASTQRFEGSNLETLLGEVRSVAGSDVRIVEANRLLRGGLAGFFAKERFEVVIELPDPDASAAASRAQANEQMRLLQMADAASDVERRELWHHQAAEEPDRRSSRRRRSFTDAPRPGSMTAAAAGHALAPRRVPSVLDAWAEDAAEQDLLPPSPIDLGTPWPTHEPQLAPTGLNPSKAAASSAASAAGTAATAAALAAASAAVRAASGSSSAFDAVLDRLTSTTRTSTTPATPTPATTTRTSTTPVPIAATAARPPGGDAQTPAPPPRSPEPAVRRSGPSTTSTTPAPEADSNRTETPLHAGRDQRRSLITNQLVGLGLPKRWVDDADLYGEPIEVIARLIATYAPQPHRLGRDSIVAIVGDPVDAFGVAQRLAEELGLYDCDVHGAVMGRRPTSLAPSQWLAGPDVMLERRRAWLSKGGVTLVVLGAGMGREGQQWCREMLHALQPDETWAVVEASRKPEDIEAWSARVGRVDALAVCRADDSVSPAAVLATGIPVTRVDNRPATPMGWGLLLADRLVERTAGTAYLAAHQVVAPRGPLATSSSHVTLDLTGDTSRIRLPTSAA